MNKGFTLIELMVSVVVFVVVMTISLGSVISVFDASSKAHTMKSAMGTINTVIESMSKEMRFGTNYRCITVSSGDPSLPSAGTKPVPQDCALGGNALIFASSDGVNNIGYIFEPTTRTIRKRAQPAQWVEMVTPTAMTIEDMRFYTVGSSASDDFQPKVIIVIRGYAGSGESRTDFILQTMVSQRALDV